MARPDLLPGRRTNPLPAEPPCNGTTGSKPCRGAGLLPPGDAVAMGRPAALWTSAALGRLFSAHRWRILLTYGLFNLENLVLLLRPWVLGLVISGLLAGSYGGLALLFVQHLAYMLLSAARQMYDTRTFAGIYARLASQVVLAQRGRNVDVSRIAARSALSREIVNFFEFDVPHLLHSVYSVMGALLMLTLCDRWFVPVCLLLMLPVCLLSAAVGRRTYTLNNHLNNQLEREVTIISRGRSEEVDGHYGQVAHWQIRLSDCQALNFGLLNLFVVSLMAAALLRCCTVFSADAGRIFTMFGYVMMFVMGLVDVPVLVQRLSRLRDISQRIH